MRFYAIIKQGTGKATTNGKAGMDNYIASLGRVDKDVSIVIEVKEQKRTRTISQNKFYWLCLGIILDRMRELGHSPDEMDKETLHDFFLGMFHYSEILNETTGEVIKIARKSSTMSTQEFIDYMEHVKRWNAEWIDLVLPEPNQQLEIQ